jgi:hypothetical protein
MATRRASGSSEYKVSSRMPPARLHVPTCEQKSRTSFRMSPGPSTSSARER